MPAERAAFDTNVLLYLIGADPVKAARAEALLAIGGHVSVQMLAEYVNVARRKTTRSQAQIEAMLTLIQATCEVHPLTLAIHEAARGLVWRDHLPMFDAQIIASALSIDATTLWSEDMQHGRVFDGRLTIRNPFRQPS